MREISGRCGKVGNRQASPRFIKHRAESLIMLIAGSRSSSKSATTRTEITHYDILLPALASNPQGFQANINGDVNHQFALGAELFPAPRAPFC